ncbi:MAG: dihydrouridine synthase [Desulfobulbus propionicus]|nr:MAG: dihydrouridine synthase [Desulfobulbus propionicus]
MTALPFFPPLCSAPMVGVSHSALRTLFLQFGGVGLLFTEMLAARRLPVENPIHSPFLFTTEQERPLCYQLLLTTPAAAEPAVDALHTLGADAVDINLGCPAPNVRESGGGSKLVDDLDLTREIVRAVRSRTNLPLSAKIRLGEDLDAARLERTCRMLEEEGLDMLTVHARLRRESFSRKPRWPWVGRVKSWVSIPVIANGGIDSVASARRCLDESGADGLMIGRAAVVRPWLFAEIAREVYSVELPKPQPDLPALYREFVQMLGERFRPERRLGRLKEFTQYFALNYAFGHHLASAVQSAATLPQAMARAESFFTRHAS